MRLRPLPLVVVPGLLQLVSARPAARPTRRGRVSAGKPLRLPTRKQSLGLLGPWGRGRRQWREFRVALEVEGKESGNGDQSGDPEASAVLMEDWDWRAEVKKAESGREEGEREGTGLLRSSRGGDKGRRTR